MNPGTLTSTTQNPAMPTPTQMCRNLSPRDKDDISKVFSNSLNWMLANENIRLGDLIDTALCISRRAREEKIDWEELECSSSDEAEPGISESGPLDPYGVPLALCFICEKTNVVNHLTSYRIYCKKAHISCLPWKAPQDSSRSEHFYWQCPDHDLLMRLTQRGHSKK